MIGYCAYRNYKSLSLLNRSRGDVVTPSILQETPFDARESNYKEPWDTEIDLVGY